VCDIKKVECVQLDLEDLVSIKSFSEVAVCCFVLQCFAVCCSEVIQTPYTTGLFCSVLQCVAVCCSVLQCAVVCCCEMIQTPYTPGLFCSVLQCVAVCCSVLQCVAVCCSEVIQTPYHRALLRKLQGFSAGITGLFCVFAGLFCRKGPA